MASMFCAAAMRSTTCSSASHAPHHTLMSAWFGIWTAFSILEIFVWSRPVLLASARPVSPASARIARSRAARMPLASLIRAVEVAICLTSSLAEKFIFAKVRQFCPSLHNVANYCEDLSFSVDGLAPAKLVGELLQLGPARHQRGQ